MKFYLMFATGLLIGFMFGYAANAEEPYKLPGYYQKQVIVRPLPGYYQKQVIVRPLLGADIVAPTYHPVVIPKCYDSMAIHEIPCTEKQNEESRLRNRERKTAYPITPHPYSTY